MFRNVMRTHMYADTHTADKLGHVLYNIPAIF